MIRLVSISLVLLAGLSISACKPPENHAVQNNVIKEYVEVPKEKAQEARKKLEALQERQEDQANKIDED